MKIRNIVYTASITVGFLVFLFAGLAQAAQPGADSIIGIWTTSKGEANIQIYKCGGCYCGKIIWTRDKPGVDVKNPDPALRGRAIIGMQMMNSFSFDGKERWTGGKIYDSDNGKTYSALITLDSPAKLRLRGYLLISLLGKSTVWTRVRR